MTTEAVMVFGALKNPAVLQVLAWASGLPVHQVRVALKELTQEQS